MTDFDRVAEDVGNVLCLEHVNLTVPDQGLAALFYVTGLGFTRDPYIDFGTRNMWINAGEQQFHLPLGEAQRFRGRIHVVVPSLDGLRHRLDRIGRELADTAFDFASAADHVAVCCPWGNRIVAHGPDDFAPMALGIPCLEVNVASGCARGIGRFYRDVMRCPVTSEDGRTVVRVGAGQMLVFEETEDPIAAYDGHHIAVYLANFSGPYTFLAARGLITEESDQHQYRFQSIVDTETGAPMCELEHEVRAMTHPMFKRPLVNRDPAIRVTNYRRGKEIFTPP